MEPNPNSSNFLEEETNLSYEKKEHSIKVYDPYGKNGNKFTSRSLAVNQKIVSSIEGGKWYKKPNCCLYCKGLYSKLVEHLCSAHSAEVLVKIASVLKIKSKKRRAAFGKIRLMGNDLFNNDLTINPDQKLIVSRRLKKNTAATNVENNNNISHTINIDDADKTKV